MSDDTPEAGPRGARGGEQQFVTFFVDGEKFAVPMGPVQEIIRVPEVARLPLAPPALQGLANLRGRVLPLVNLRHLFGTAPRPHDDATRALVIHLGQPLGFVVDRVASVVNVDPADIEPAAPVRGLERTRGVSGVIKCPQADPEHPLLMVVDFERLIEGQLAAGGAGTERVRGLDGGTARSVPAHGDEAASDDLRLVSFTVSGQEYGIPIADVQEIVQLPERITAVPNAPPQVLGLISLRRRLLPLLSLRTLFGLPAAAADEHHRIVVVAVPGSGPVGLVTDTVKEVLSVPRQQADAMPGVMARDARLQEFQHICRLEEGRRLVSVIAIDRLLGLDEVRQALATATGEPAPASAGDDDVNTTNAPNPQRRAAAADDDLQVVIFRLGAEEFGVPIMSVQEIVRVPEALTRVPRTPAFVEGVINLRGTVLPVMDQRARLGLQPIARNDRQRIMVYTLGGLRTGFIVDSVAEVLRIPRERIEPAPELSDEQGRLIAEIAKLEGDRRLVMLIEPARLLGAQELSSMRGLGHEAAEPQPAPAPEALAA